MSGDPACQMLAEALGLGVDQIDETTAIGTTSAWDSIAHMRLVMALEGHLGRQLEPDEIFALASYTDVSAMVGSMK